MNALQRACVLRQLGRGICAKECPPCLTALSCYLHPGSHSTCVSSASDAAAAIAAASSNHPCSACRHVAKPSMPGEQVGDAGGPDGSGAPCAAESQSAAEAAAAEAADEATERFRQWLRLLLFELLLLITQVGCLCRADKHAARRSFRCQSVCNVEHVEFKAVMRMSDWTRTQQKSSIHNCMCMAAGAAPGGLGGGVASGAGRAAAPDSCGRAARRSLAGRPAPCRCRRAAALRRALPLVGLSEIIVRRYDF